MHEFELHEFFHSQKNVYLKALLYGFCKRLLGYKWTSDQLNTFFLTFFSRSVLRKKVFNWSEVHLVSVVCWLATWNNESTFFFTIHISWFLQVWNLKILRTEYQHWLNQCFLSGLGFDLILESIYVIFLCQKILFFIKVTYQPYFSCWIVDMTFDFFAR